MELLESVLRLAVAGVVVFTAAYQGTIRALRAFVEEATEESDGGGSGASGPADLDWLKRS